ncbi:hypothetical protein AAZX31_08G231300 [Glycine max]|uniref:LOB domain-containing protein n=2 Tax=Glycine subgen. Soja TaxID=1462606 RepID=A0A0R0IRH1_SOYBN|nr:LOB domain-containing protein 5 [Glycine max]XP_028246683.1 LOB domain-containing protein 5-like [Glycine soja]KAG5001062.1 hypothetical protein JHK87_022134 [Glycine soja]KAG5016560.1 hypothetical protein JHK85_022696 [Glycine max]KAG5026323.1 hypothetical protein JHK86_022237 [Glycine max]KAG5137480.1 hypothetical protein JHK82_022211 [Glycine max]KAH1052739.1 hypothetical protein GYH30_022174 [Glycine max]|eukprot:XP_006585733.1 LOB domain-containing protein 5 [Glycine max]
MSQGNRNYFSCPICRNQRRRHDDNCEFGQYFLGRSTDFESACRLFGFANLVRLMRSVEPSERQATADSILMEANIWDRDPINGAYGHVFNLVSQIQSFESELETINNWLAHIRDQQRQPSSFSPNIPNQSIQDEGSNTPIPSLIGADISTRSSEKGESSIVAPKEDANIVVRERDSKVDDNEEGTIPDKEQVDYFRDD